MWVWYTIHEAFAGLGRLALHWGIGIVAISLLIALEYFSASVGAAVPILAPFLAKFRKDLLWLALGIGLFLAGGYVTGVDMANRCKARAAVIDKQIKAAVQGAQKKPGLDKWDVNK